MTVTSEPPAEGVKLSRTQVVQAMSGLMMGMFVAILASTVVANALPRIVSDLGGSQSSYTWVVTTELLAMTATVPLWGKLSDLYNKKLLIQLSLAMFVIGSLVAGFSQDIGTLIASRVVQGVGAGGLTALAQVVMAAMVSPRELGRYMGIFGAVFAVGTVAGPLIGGVMVDTSWLGWRWCFLLGVPFALAAILLLQRTLKLPTVRREGAKVDYLGALLIMLGVSTLLVWTTLAGNKFDWLSGWTYFLVGAGLVVLALAVWVESRVSEPIVPLSIFRNRTVTLTTVVSFLVGVAMFGGTVFLSQYFQLSLGKTPTVAGLMGLPMIFGLLVSSTASGQIISRTGKWKNHLILGGALMVLGFALLATMSRETSVLVLSIYMFVLGAGVGMLMQNLVLVAQNDVAAQDLGAATSVLSFFRSLGGSIGVSVLGAVLANRVTSEITTKLGPLPGGDSSGAVPDLSVLPEPIATVIRDAYGVATSEIFLFCLPFAVLALLVILFLKQIPLKTLTGSERLAEETGVPITPAH
ncbi:MAG: MDR family MFS transporter [Kibdelosporangium sp.]